MLLVDISNTGVPQSNVSRVISISKKMKERDRERETKGERISWSRRNVEQPNASMTTQSCPEPTAWRGFAMRSTPEVAGGIFVVPIVSSTRGTVQP